MPMGGGVALLAVGAILMFAVTGSIHIIDLSVVGAIFMIAGTLVLLPTVLARTRPRGNRPDGAGRQDVIEGEPQAAVERARYNSSLDRRRVNGRRRR
jgi:hypothetical protein